MKKESQWRSQNGKQDQKRNMKLDCYKLPRETKHS